MPRVIITKKALQGLKDCRKFLAKKNVDATKRAAKVIAEHFILLETTPEIGKPFLGLPGLREITIEFGDSGYIALYRYDESSDTVYILAFRHQKEAGYISIVREEASF